MSRLPDDPFANEGGSALSNLLKEGSLLVEALAALGDEPDKLSRALTTLRGDDLRAMAFAIVLQRWVDESTERKERERRERRWWRRLHRFLRRPWRRGR